MRKAPQALPRWRSGRRPRAAVAIVPLVVALVVPAGLVSRALFDTVALPEPAPLEASAPLAEPPDGVPDEAVAADAPPAVPQAANASLIRVPRPEMPTGPRRVGIQAGHWLTEAAPPELGRIVHQTGAAWAGLNERDINLAVAHRVADLLRARGIAVDVLPTTIPPGYLADAFVALHADSDGGDEVGVQARALVAADAARGRAPGADHRGVRRGDRTRLRRHGDHR